MNFVLPAEIQRNKGWCSFKPLGSLKSKVNADRLKKPKMTFEHLLCICADTDGHHWTLSGFKWNYGLTPDCLWMSCGTVLQSVNITFLCSPHFSVSLNRLSLTCLICLSGVFLCTLFNLHMVHEVKHIYNVSEIHTCTCCFVVFGKLTMQCGHLFSLPGVLMVGNCRYIYINIVCK